jgi:hypothetical protein
LGAGLTIQPCKKVIVTKSQKGDQGPNWAVEPYDDDPTTSLEGLRKFTKKFIQDRLSPVRDLNPEPPEYEATVLTT